MIKETVDSKIKDCIEALSQVGVAAQKYIDEHDKYLERESDLKDSTFIKDRIKDKIARVVDSE